MNTSELKKIIKQSVKEAIKEELMSTLLTVLNESKHVSHSPTPVKEHTISSNSLIKERMPAPDFTEFKRTTADIPSSYNPPPFANTSAEGSALPSGEVNLAQIMGLINTK